MTQLQFDVFLLQAEKTQETKSGQRKVAEVIASLLSYSFDLEDRAHQMKGLDSAQRRLSQVQIAKEIRSRLSKL